MDHTASAAGVYAASFTDNGAAYVAYRTFTTLVVFEMAVDADGMADPNDLTLAGCYERGPLMMRRGGAMQLNVSGKYLGADACGTMRGF